jgi:hypothetical protein
LCAERGRVDGGALPDPQLEEIVGIDVERRDRDRPLGHPSAERRGAQEHEVALAGERRVVFRREDRRSFTDEHQLHAVEDDRGTARRNSLVSTAIGP